VDAVVNVLDVGERQKMVQPVGGVILRKSDLVGFDAIDNAHVQAIIAHDFHMLFDLVARDHVGLSVLAFERNSGALAEFRINLDLLARADSFWCPRTCGVAALWMTASIRYSTY
jgi:hypothetical protein